MYHALCLARSAINHTSRKEEWLQASRTELAAKGSSRPFFVGPLDGQHGDGDYRCWITVARRMRASVRPIYDPERGPNCVSLTLADLAPLNRMDREGHQPTERGTVAGAALRWVGRLLLEQADSSAILSVSSDRSPGSVSTAKRTPLRCRQGTIMQEALRAKSTRLAAEPRRTPSITTKLPNPLVAAGRGSEGGGDQNAQSTLYLPAGVGNGGHHMSNRMSIPEIARRLDIGRLAVYAMLEQGLLPGIRLGRRWIVTRPAFEAWEKTCGTRTEERTDTGFRRDIEVPVVN